MDVNEAALRRFDKVSEHRLGNPSCAYSVTDVRD